MNDSTVDRAWQLARVCGIMGRFGDVFWRFGGAVLPVFRRCWERFSLPLVFWAHYARVMPAIWRRAAVTQIGQPQQQRQPLRNLVQTPIAHRGVAKAPLHPQELCSTLALTDALRCSANAAALSVSPSFRRCPGFSATFQRCHGASLMLRPLLHPQRTRRLPTPAALAVQQRSRLRHVVHVRRRGDEAVHYPRLRVGPDVQLHPKVILVPLLHLNRIAGSRSPSRFFVDVGAAMMVDVHYGPRSQPQAPTCQMRVDLRQQPLSQPALLQQVPKVQDKSSRPAAPLIAAAPRTAAPVPPRTAWRLPSQGHSDCRTTAHSVAATSPTRDTAAAHAPPWDSTARCADSISAHGSSASIRSKNFSRRVLRFFCAYSQVGKRRLFHFLSPTPPRRFLAMILCQGLTCRVFLE